MSTISLLHRQMLTFIPYPNYYSIPHDTRSFVSSAIQIVTNPAAVVPLQRLRFSAELLPWLALHKVILQQAATSLLIFPSMSLVFCTPRELTVVSIDVSLFTTSLSCSCLLAWRRMTSWPLAVQALSLLRCMFPSLFVSSPLCHRWLVQMTVAHLYEHVA